MAVPRNGAGAGLVVPAPSRRPGSATFGDVYGGLDFATPTSQAGGEGAAARAAAAGLAPLSVQGLSPAFLRSESGVLLLFIVLLAIWSYLDR